MDSRTIQAYIPVSEGAASQATGEIAAKGCGFIAANSKHKPESHFMCSPTERMRTPDRNTQCANYCARLRGYTLPTSGRSTGQLCKRAESASDTAPIPLTDAVIASEHTWQSERRRLADLRFKAATWIQLSHAKPHCGRTHSDFRMRWEGARR